jgi:hypothetical protein
MKQRNRDSYYDGDPYASPKYLADGGSGGGARGRRLSRLGSLFSVNGGRAVGVSHFVQ